jgi:hypothetical protein
LEVALIALLIILLVNFVEPVSRWAGEYMGDAFERSIANEQGQ